MANRRYSKRYTNRGNRRSSEWRAAFNDTVLASHAAGAVITSQVLVGGSGITFVRLVGSICFVPQDYTGEGIFHMMLHLNTAEGGTGLDPSQNTTTDREDILWWMAKGFRKGAGVNDGGGGFADIQLDIRVKRRMPDADYQLQFGVTSDVAFKKAFNARVLVLNS